jgi:integrase/recombinase XerD
MLLHEAIKGFLIDISTNYSLQTVRLYRFNLKLFEEQVNNPEVQEISCHDVADFIRYLRTDYIPKRTNGDTSPLSPSAIDNYWKAVRSFFGWCHRVLGIPRPDLTVQRPKYRLPEVIPFNKDELKRIIRCCDWTREAHPDGQKSYHRRRPTATRDKALVLLLLDTGLRLGEVCRLKLIDVDIETGQVLVSPFGSGQKTKPRIVYLGKTSRRAVWLYLAEDSLDQNDPLFFRDDASLRSIIRNLGIRAGVKNCHPHRFRHTFAIEYLRNGGDPFTLQSLLGHSSIDMVQHYLRIMELDRKAAHSRASPVDMWKL